MHCKMHFCFVQVQMEMEKAIAVDPTVYEYDNIYDDLQAKKSMTDKRVASDVERKVRLSCFCSAAYFMINDNS